MNGEPLPPVHGAPLRVVVPGYIGARSVKWLQGIELRSQPWQGYYQHVVYRLLAEEGAGLARARGCRWGSSRSTPTYCHRPTARPCPPAPVEVRGYAFAGGERYVARVDVSVDDGPPGRTPSSWTTSAAGLGASGGSRSTWRPASTRSSFAPGIRRRRPSPRARRGCGTRRATSTTPGRGSGSPQWRVRASRDRTRGSPSRRSNAASPRSRVRRATGDVRSTAAMNAFGNPRLAGLALSPPSFGDGIGGSELAGDRCRQPGVPDAGEIVVDVVVVGDVGSSYPAAPRAPERCWIHGTRLPLSDQVMVGVDERQLLAARHRSTSSPWEPVTGSAEGSGTAADVAHDFVVLGRVAAPQVPRHPVRVGADHQQVAAGAGVEVAGAGRKHEHVSLAHLERSPPGRRASPTPNRARSPAPRGRSSGSGGRSKSRRARRPPSRCSRTAAHTPTRRRRPRRGGRSAPGAGNWGSRRRPRMCGCSALISTDERDRRIDCAATTEEETWRAQPAGSGTSATHGTTRAG